LALEEAKSKHKYVNDYDLASIGIEELIKACFEEVIYEFKGGSLWYKTIMIGRALHEERLKNEKILTQIGELFAKLEETIKMKRCSVQIDLFFWKYGRK